MDLNLPFSFLLSLSSPIPGLSFVPTLPAMTQHNRYLLWNLCSCLWIIHMAITPLPFCHPPFFSGNFVFIHTHISFPSTASQSSIFFKSAACLTWFLPALFVNAQLLSWLIPPLSPSHSLFPFSPSHLWQTLLKDHASLPFPRPHPTAAWIWFLFAPGGHPQRTKIDT